MESSATVKSPKRVNMRVIAFRNIISHKLRLALTVLSVTLGTAFIAGAFMFTNSLSATFSAAVGSAFDDVDAAVSAGGEGQYLSAEMVDTIASDDKVDKVNRLDTVNVAVADEQAEAFQTGGATSSVQIFYPPEDTVGKPNKIVEGAAPLGTQEMVVNESAAEEFDIAVGDSIIVVRPEQRLDVTVSGIYERSVDIDPESSLKLLIDEDSYHELFLRSGESNRLAVGAAAGTEPQGLVDYLNETYPEVEALTGSELADQVTEEVRNALSFVNYFLIAFGLIGLLVGTFIIANTFSMIVAQRIKEFALLRSLGASQRQITSSVIVEAVLVGLMGSALGVLAGMGLVAIIRAIMAGQGMPFYDSGVGLSLSAVAVPVVLGIVVTIISAWAPARRAGQVAPVEAMRTTESAAGASLKVRTIIGAVAAVAGIASVIVGVVLDAGTGPRASLVGLGMLLLVFGYFMAGPALSLPIVPTLGRILGAPFGQIGRLAATNAQRSPRRTAATAFALTLGMMLVTGISMLGETMKASVSDFVSNTVKADYIASGPLNGSFPVPDGAPEPIAAVEGVEQAATFYQVPVTVDGAASVDFGPQFQSTSTLDANPSEVFDLEAVEGTMEFSDNAGVVVSERLAKARGWSVGDSVTVEAAGFPAMAADDSEPQSAETTIAGIYSAEAQLVGNTLVDANLANSLVADDEKFIEMVLITTEDGSDEEQVRERLNEAVKDFIVIQIRTGEEMAGESAQFIDTMLSILYGLLALAVIIAILGIVNTLTLGVIERRQEIGMLRAVGAYRRQIRIMIILEAVQIAIFGALMGVLAGLGLGWAFVEVLSDEGLNSGLVIPWTDVVVMMVGSAVVGVVAALWPSYKAAKTPPLEAIAD